MAANPQALMQAMMNQAKKPEAGQINKPENLNGHVDKQGSTILNAEGSLNSLLEESNPAKVTSDSDADLLFHIKFTELVNITAISIVSKPPSDDDSDNGDDNAAADDEDKESESDDDEELQPPNIVKVWANPGNLDFDDCCDGDSKPTDSFDVDADAVQNGQLFKTKLVRFRNICNLTIFMTNEESDKTLVNNLSFYGTKVHRTNMNELKKVG